MTFAAEIYANADDDVQMTGNIIEIQRLIRKNPSREK
jgi:hypothetical protein